MRRELKGPPVQAARKRHQRTVRFPVTLPFHLIKSELGMARLVEDQNSGLANFRLQLDGTAAVWPSSRRRFAVCPDKDQIGKLERTILATKNSQGGLVGLEV